MIYLLTAVWLTPAGSSTVHIYTQTINRTTQYNRILRVFENRVLRRIFGTKRDEVKGELSDLYCSPNVGLVIKSRIVRWAGHVARMGERRGVFRIFCGSSEGKRPLWRP
jgi:hypothetical protein